MITWTRKSGPVHYQSRDHIFTVAEAYRFGRFGFSAIHSGSLSALPLGPLRKTAEESRDDCDRFERGEVTKADIDAMLAAEREACGVVA